MFIRHIISILCIVTSIIGCKKHPHQERESNIFLNNKNRIAPLYKRNVSTYKWIEINILSGTWTDWKIFINKIYKRNQVQHNSGKQSVSIRIPWVRLSKTGDSSIKTNESSIYYSNVPIIMLYAQVRIEGDSSFLHRTQYIDGFSATWRNRFFLDLNKYSKNFITFEFVANLVDKKIPDRKKTYIIGSETVSVHSLLTESKVWKFNLKSGHLNVLTTPTNDSNYVKSTKQKWSDIFTIPFFENTTYNIGSYQREEIIKLQDGKFYGTPYRRAYHLSRCYFHDFNQDGIKDVVVLIVGADGGGKAASIPVHIFLIMNFGGHPVVMDSRDVGGTSSVTGVSNNKIHIRGYQWIPGVSITTTYSLVYKNGRLQTEDLVHKEKREEQ